MSKRRSLEKPIARALRRIAVFVALLACALGIYISVKIADANRFYAYRHADRDNDTILDFRDDDLDGDGIPNIEDGDSDDDDVENWVQAIEEAEELIGKHADKLDGAFDNLGVRMGFFRNADVVLVAYEKAGLYLTREIEDDALGAGDDYQTVLKGDKVDIHDARALSIFFERKGWSLVTWRIAQKGDIIFFGHQMVGLVVDYQERTGYVVIWADPDSHRIERASTTQIEMNGYSPGFAVSIGD